MPWGKNVLADWGRRVATRAQKDADLLELVSSLREGMPALKDDVVATALYIVVFEGQPDEPVE